MKTHEASAALDVCLERRLVGIAQVGCVALVDHDDIGIFEVGRARGMQRAVHNGPVLGQHFAPVREKLRVVMLAHIVGLQPRPDIYVHAVAVLAGRQGRAPWTGRHGRLARTRRAGSARRATTRRKAGVTSIHHNLHELSAGGTLDVGYIRRASGLSNAGAALWQSKKVAPPVSSGLCATCVHAKTITSDRGSIFVRCTLCGQRPAIPEVPAIAGDCLRRLEGSILNYGRRIDDRTPSDLGDDFGGRDRRASCAGRPSAREGRLRHGADGR